MNKQPQNRTDCPAFECFRLDSTVYPGDFPVPLHKHYFCELLLVREGSCRIVRNNTTAHPLEAGEAVYFSSMVSHSVEPVGDLPLVIDIVKFSVTRLKEIPGYLEDLRAMRLDAANLSQPLWMNTEQVKKHYLGHIVRQCIQENEQHEFAYDLRVRALIYLIITALARFWLEQRDFLSAAHQIRQDPLAAVPAYIEQHLSEPLKVEALAAMCGMSYPWFAKRFRECYGVGCKQFIARLRMDFVEQYLAYTDMDLEEISRKTGFTDSSHMVKCFRQMRNITPGQYRSLVRLDGHPPFSRFYGDQSRNPAQRVDTQGKNG